MKKGKQQFHGIIINRNTDITDEEIFFDKVTLSNLFALVFTWRSDVTFLLILTRSSSCRK